MRKVKAVSGKKTKRGDKDVIHLTSQIEEVVEVDADGLAAMIECEEKNLAMYQRRVEEIQARLAKLREVQSL